MVGEDGGGLLRARSARANTDDGAIIRNLVKTIREITERDIDGSRYLPSREFVGLSHVEQKELGLGVESGDEFVDVDEVDCRRVGHGVTLGVDNVTRGRRSMTVP